MMADPYSLLNTLELGAEVIVRPYTDAVSIDDDWISSNVEITAEPLDDLFPDLDCVSDLQNVSPQKTSVTTTDDAIEAKGDIDLKMKMKTRLKAVARRSVTIYDDSASQSKIRKTKKQDSSKNTSLLSKKSSSRTVNSRSRNSTKDVNKATEASTAKGYELGESNSPKSPADAATDALLVKNPIPGKFSLR